MLPRGRSAVQNCAGLRRATALRINARACLYCDAITSYCPALSDPINGRVTQSNSLDDRAEYVCSPGFQLASDGQPLSESTHARVCKASNAKVGVWDGVAATCDVRP
eukprot:482353_1